MTKINSMKKERQKRFFAICSSNLTWVLVVAEISVKYSVKEIMKASQRLRHILCPLQPSGAFKDEVNYTH